MIQFYFIITHFLLHLILTMFTHTVECRTDIQKMRNRIKNEEKFMAKKRNQQKHKK